MARRSNTLNGTRQRDISNLSLGSLLAFPVFRPIVIPRLTPPQLPDLEDRRLYAPGRSTTPPKGNRPGAGRVRAKGLYGLKFTAPRHVAICARRKIRREVLFAIKRTRKGSNGRKHRNFWSAVSC